jgi:hypothetical protein
VGIEQSQAKVINFNLRNERLEHVSLKVLEASAAEKIVVLFSLPPA